jgi:hypothetical protein
MAKSYEARDYLSLGPQFRIDVNEPITGSDGISVYKLYSYNDSNDVNLMAFTESGSFKLYNDRSIEIVAGNKSSPDGVDIVIAGLNGDITITAMSNGNVKIKGKNIMIEAVEDLDLKAGRNITAQSGSGRILMKANKIDQTALSGNAVINTFSARCFAPTPLGADFSFDSFVGGTDVTIGIG